MADLPNEVLIDRRMHAWRPEDWPLLDRREGQVLYTRVYERVGEFDHQGIDPADLGQHFRDGANDDQDDDEPQRPVLLDMRRMVRP